jgi:hypothetical protein
MFLIKIGLPELLQVVAQGQRNAEKRKGRVCKEGGLLALQDESGFADDSNES